MPKLSKKSKEEWSLFLNPETGRRMYNPLCIRCERKCKQSFRAVVIHCPKYKSKRGTKRLFQSPQNPQIF